MRPDAVKRKEESLESELHSNVPPSSPGAPWEGGSSTLAWQATCSTLTVTTGEIRGQLCHLEAVSAALMVSHCGCERNTSLPGGWLRWYIYQRVCKPPTVTHQLGKDCKNIRELCSWRNTQDGMGPKCQGEKGWIGWSWKRREKAAEMGWQSDAPCPTKMFTCSSWKL